MYQLLITYSALVTCLRQSGSTVLFIPIRARHESL